VRVTATPTRPPFPPSDGVQVAVIYFAIVVGLFASMLPFSVVIAVEDGDWAALPGLASLSIAVAFVGLLARALARRRAWARIPSIVVTALMTVVAALGAIYALWNSDDHGSTYVLMGAVMWCAFGVVVLVKFVRTAGPEAFRPCASGWMNDPSHEARLRYWDGERWTVHVAP
jgi:predicted membrane channel-forming protein YqfA (hemolysin III family)